MRENIRHSLVLGAVGGLAAWHLSLVGMVETFANRRLIGESVRLSYVLLLAIAVLVGYLAARRWGPDWRGTVLAALAGLAVGAATALLALLIDRLNVGAVLMSANDIRDIFSAATPRLAEVLTFGRGPGALGFATTLAAMTAAGAVGGSLLLIPHVWRRILVAAVMATLFVGLLRDVIGAVLPDAVDDALYTRGGLSPASAIVVAALVAILLVAHVAIRRPGTVGRIGLTPLQAARWEGNGIRVIGLVTLVTFPLWAEIFLSNVADFVGLYIAMALGLNLVVGFAGLLDLGFVAFFAIGAYTMAILTSPELGTTVDFWVALPIAILAAVAAGVLLGLPVLRMRGDYLAIATLGFGEIVRILVLSDWLKPYLGGAQGVTRIDNPVIGPANIEGPRGYYYLILIGVGLAWFLSVRLRDSRIGRAWMAIREDEDVAQAMGINRVLSKLLAFALGASMGGLSGAMFASLVGSVVPASFSLLVSINVLAVIIVGGMGSLPGIVVGALALVALPELLREFAEYRLLVYGAVLVAMMLFRPEGLWPSEVQEREVEAREEPFELPPPVDMVATAEHQGEG